MTLSDDRALLGVADNATLEDLKVAYYALAAKIHPDHGGDAGEFANLRATYDRLVAHAKRPKVCPICLGVGKVVVRSGFYGITKRCDPCFGTGVVGGFVDE